MWGRASMAAVILLILGWTCMSVQGEASSSQVTSSTDSEAEAILDRAVTWLWSQRDKNAGWGNDTHRVLLALRLSNLTREDNVPPPAPLELQLSEKQMELEIVLLLWRHREVGFSSMRFAGYTLALNALCVDPKRFHGHDLIGTLQHHDPPADYDFAFMTLATCSAQAHVRKRQIRRLLDIANAAQDHNVDTVAMVVLALKCIVQDHRHRNLHHFVRKPSVGLAQQQRPDGSFGDLRTTALVMQALEEVENEPLDNWNRSASISWIASRQKPNGSFNNDVRVTAETILGVARRGIDNLRTLECEQGVSDSLNSRPTATSVADVPTPEKKQTRVIQPTGSSNMTTTITSTTGLPSTEAVPVFVNVTYTLWVGSNVNETYNMTLTVPKNESFYNIMVSAAEKSKHFQFVASEWPNGHYVHTLAGYKEEPMSYHYWLLYRLPSLPRSSSPPGNQLVAPGGVDDLRISEGDHYLFWYKKL